MNEENQSPSPAQSPTQAQPELKVVASPELRLQCYAGAVKYLHRKLEERKIAVGDILPLHSSDSHRSANLPTSVVLVPGQHNPGALLEVAVFSVEMPESHRRNPMVIAASGPLLPVQVTLQPDLNAENPVYIVYVIMLSLIGCVGSEVAERTKWQIDCLVTELEKILKSDPKELAAEQPRIVIPGVEEAQAVKRSGRLN